MRKYTLFEGELLDGSINEVIPGLIQTAKLKNEDVFLRWNGATVRIMPDSTAESVHRDYQYLLHEQDLFTKERNGELISVQDLAQKIAKTLVNL